MQAFLRWLMIAVIIIQTVVLVTGEPPVKVSRKQIGVVVFFNFLLILALLPMN